MPAPFRDIGQQQPKGFRQRAGKMRDRRIDRDHQVQCRHQGGGVGEVLEIIGDYLNLGMLGQERPVGVANLLLQQHEVHVAAEQGLDRAQRHRAVAVVLVVRVAGGDNAHPPATVRGQASLPGRHALGIRTQVGHGCGDGIRTRCGGQGQAGQWALAVELGQILARGDQLAHARQTR